MRRSLAAIVGLLVAAFFFHHHAHRRPVATIASWAAPGPVNPLAPAPSLVDPTGFYTFCGEDSHGLLEVCHDGQVQGAYVDDTDPTRAGDVAEASALYGFVIAALAPDGDPCSQFQEPGVVCALEIYPYDCRYTPGAWGPLPVLAPGEGAIVQWWFAWPGCGPPTPQERQYLLQLVEAEHPRLVLLY